MSALVPKPPMQLVDPQAQIVVDFLRNMGLPHDNIIAAQDQRSIIGQNLPAYIEGLPKGHFPKPTLSPDARLSP